MAREATITYDQVAAAADSVKANGGRPTTRAVREALGTGSMATVLKFLQQWTGKELRTAESTVILPAGLQRALVDFVGQEVAGAIADLRADLMDAQQANVDLIVESERQAATIEIQAAELEMAQVDKAGLAGRLSQVESDLARSSDDIVAERSAAEHARTELAKAQLRLEAVPRIEAETEKTSAELHKVRALAAELHEAAAVATAKLEAEAAQRKALEARLIEANQQREEAAKRILAASEALSNERVSVQACQARLEAAAREIAAANEAASKARTEAKKSGEEAAELRGQIAAEKKSVKLAKTTKEGGQHE